MESTKLYIGLMSGTSIDGVDVALVDFSENKCQLLKTYIHPINSKVKEKLIRLSSPISNSNPLIQSRIELMAETDVIMGHIFADAVNQLIKNNQINPASIIAIGSHGQTIRHRPNQSSPFTLQIGDANIITEKTGITTIADFRRMDIAAGGQGAPLAPAFHNAVLRSENENRIVLNLGGIANITYLAKDPSEHVIGFDTGPANTLLDAWFKKHHLSDNADFDKDSNFAKNGKLHPPLLQCLLTDPFFSLPHPKSTGREYFSLNWLENKIAECGETITKEDIQRTLLEFTTRTIADAIKVLNVEQYRVFACGGGMHNQFLLENLSGKLNCIVIQTNDVDIDGDYLEAMTFAWLAKQRCEELPGNLPSVTGAKKSKVLGAVYLP